MANILGELLVECVAALVRAGVYALWLKSLTWLGSRIRGRTTAIVVAVLMAALLFFLMPLVTGLIL
jgi:hypothetical protein